MKRSTAVEVFGLAALAVGGVQAYRVYTANKITKAVRPIDGHITPEVANVNAALWMIRMAEGTANEMGYKTIYGYKYFNDFSKHPNITNCVGGYCSSAAGAYQILYRTWNDCRLYVSGLNDFSPANQDKAAVWLISRRGVLDLVKAGRIEEAIIGNGKRGNGLCWEWASLPGNDYGQPRKSIAQLKTIFTSAGGVLV